MCSIQMRNVLLSRDQSGLSRTLTEYLEDKQMLIVEFLRVFINNGSWQ